MTYRSLAAASALVCVFMGPLSGATARADRAPPPTRRIVMKKVETGPCERDGKAIDCPKEATAATDAMLVRVRKLLLEKPIRCGFGREAEHALHMYWGDGFGSVVNIDFDPEGQGLPECAGALIEHVSTALTGAFEPFGKKDPELRVHWTVGFSVEH